MTDFKLLFSHELTEQAFDEHPVWSEFYDYEELEEIVSWGVDRDWLMKEWKEKHTGSEHCLYTLLRTDPLPQRMRLFIKAEITTANGIKLKGYVMNEDAFVVGVFLEGKEFAFSRHSAEYDESERLELREMISTTEEAIFPLAYKTHFKNSEGNPIAGEFC